VRRTALILMALLGAPGGAAAAQPSPRMIDSTEVQVMSRLLDSVRSEREQIGRLRGEADARYSVGRARMAESETQLAILEKEIGSVDARIKSAKKEKRDADKTVAEFDKKDLERRKQLLERRLDLRRAEVDQAQAEMDYADATARALDFEQQLERRRLDRADRELIVELERKTLEARLEQENRRKTVAERRAQTVQRQLGVMEAQRAFFKR
jgi:chromosome segregation ATPase